MTQQILQCISYEVKTGTGKKSGAAYSLPIAMCLLLNDDGSQTAGEVLLPKDHAPLVVGKKYTATMKIGRSQDGKLVPQFIKLYDHAK
jgi:hypothetical protein